MNLKRLSIVGMMCAGALVATACHTHTYKVGTGGNTESEPAYDQWESHWLFGIIGGPELDLKEVCPTGNATVVDEQSFLNGLVAAFTGIVWSPTTVTIYCDTGSAPPAEEEPETLTYRLTPEQMRRVAMDPRTLEWARGVSESKAAELQAAQNAYRARETQIARTTGATTF